MPHTDPTDTGGLFIGRRPGTKPVRYRTAPEAPTGPRRRLGHGGRGTHHLAGAVGLLDHYRQWAGMSEEEVGGEMRRRSTDRRERALARVDPLDLTGLEWPEFPHPDVVAAVTFAARGALNRASDAEARELRAELARRHGVEVERVVAGLGAAQLLEGAARALLGPGDELVCPWPSYRLFPRMARDAGARAVPVEGSLSPERLLAAVTQNTRIVARVPERPDGESAERRRPARARRRPARAGLDRPRRGARRLRRPRP